MKNEEKIVESLLAMRRNLLEKELVKLQRNSNKHDTREDEFLKVSRSRNSIQYYVVKYGNEKRKKYISKSNISIAKSIAQRDYEKQVRRTIEEEIKAINKFINSMPEITFEQVYYNLVEGRKLLVTPIVMPDEEYAKKWQEEEYIGKKIDAGTVGYETQRGEIVRSKSEVIIADALYYAKVPYHYEKPIKISNRIIHPDFTVLNVKTRKEYYWEHFGLLDDEEYLNKALLKLESYQKNNIREGENLILTRESKLHPLNTSIVKEMIRYYLL